MSLTNPKTVVTEERLSAFYQKLLPYLGGSADAGFTPVGSIIAMMSNSAPANYLACDGATYNISDYPELADHFFNEFGSRNYFGGDGTTTFAVPDLRGEFIRGTGTNSHTDQGNGAGVGAHQDGTTFPYTYSDATTDKIGLSANTSGALRNANNDSHPMSGTGTPKWLITAATESAGPSTGWDMITSRPTNTSVLYCIATKNIYLNPSLDYSTSEKVVGTWIDGKPLYQRTYQTTMGTSADGSIASKTINLDSSTKVVDLKCVIKRDDGHCQPVFCQGLGSNGWSEGSILASTAYVSGNIIYIQTNQTGLKGLPCFVTIRYTKTS